MPNAEPNPFETLELAPCFDLEEDELESSYMKLSAANHPDRFSDPIEQVEAVEKAAKINEAYQQLKDPERRANALLVTLGGPGPSEDKTLPPTLLTDMLEIREEMEDAQQSKDESKLNELRRWANTERTSQFNRLRKMFEGVKSDAGGQPDEGALRDIRIQLNALRYIERMIEQLDPDYNPNDADF